MDISYIKSSNKFNYRVAAAIISNDKVLIMKDERSPYSYLPGGRVQMGETAEHAILRELDEELHITPVIFRPLWLVQNFFTEDADRLNYHELCIYFLIDISKTDLLNYGAQFTLHEEKHIHSFEWISFENLKTSYFYPGFLKEEIHNLPDCFTIRTDYE